jgi:uncharacterized membrane protein (UPF0127 family)
VSGLRKKLAFFSELSVLSVAAIIAGSLAAVGAGYFFINAKQAPIQQSCSVNSELSTTNMEFKGVSFVAEVASTPAEKVKGLSDRECLAEDRALLFPYNEPGDYCYWMKDMRFPIDMIWLDAQKRVVTIKSNVAPDSYPQSFCPEGLSQYVVEFNAGTATERDLRVGDTFSF